MTLDAYSAEEQTRFAAARSYEILGESSPTPARAVEVGQSRKSMDDNGGVRNRIVHGDSGIDDPILFTTIERDLKPLLPRFEALARARG